MKITNKEKTTETHPLFPSGAWDGFYTYASGPSAQQNPMPSYFSFQEGQIRGGGGDSVGSFSWNGLYDLEQFTCKITKTYSTHIVSYSGHVDENGIWGKWVINDYCSGGFHLWPKSAENQEVEKGVIENEITRKGLF